MTDRLVAASRVEGDALVEATIANEASSPGALAALNGRLTRREYPPVPVLHVDATGRPMLDEGGGAGDLDALLRVLALDAARLIGTAERAQASDCDGDVCTMRFFDRSPARARRWCSARCSTRHHMRERRRRAASG